MGDSAIHTTVAITHVPSPRMEQCRVTYVPRAPIDFGLALKQHQQYCRMLAECGADVRTLDVNRQRPDCVFIEDTAVVLDEVAVLASMGAESRRDEPGQIEPELRRYRPIDRIQPPATLEGGDVLRLGRTLLVGLAARTNQAGIAALAAIAGPHGYRVTPVPVRNCLHLKSACGALTEQTLLVNPAWLDVSALRGFQLIRVPEEEPRAANLLRLHGYVCMAANHVRTADMLSRTGADIRTIDLSEFAKAEGGVTCLSLLFDPAERGFRPQPIRE